MKSQFLTDRLTDGYSESEARALFLEKQNTLKSDGFSALDINNELGITMPPIGLFKNTNNITKVNDVGMSDEMTVAGKQGRFNWDKEPVFDGTSQYPKYAFETDNGTQFMQVAQEVQGGDWITDPNAEQSYNQYLKWTPEDVALQMKTMWAHKPEIGVQIAQAVHQKAPFSYVQEILAGQDTSRQKHVSDVGDIDNINYGGTPEGYTKMRTDVVEWDVINDKPIYSDTPTYQVVPYGFEESALEESKKWARANQWYWDEDEQRARPPIDADKSAWDWTFTESLEYGAQQAVVVMGYKFHACQKDESKCPTSMADLLGESIYLEEQPFINQLAYSVAGIVPDTPLFWGGCKAGGAVGTKVGAAAGSAVPAVGTTVGTAAGGTIGCFAGMFGVHGAIRSIYTDLLDDAAGVGNEKEFLDYMKNAIKEFGAEAVLGALTGTGSFLLTSAAKTTANPFIRKLIERTTGKSGKQYGVGTARLLTEASIMTEVGTIDPMRNMYAGTVPQRWWPSAEEFAHNVMVLGIMHGGNTGFSKVTGKIKMHVGSTEWAVNKRLQKAFAQHGIRPEAFVEFLKANPNLTPTIMAAMRKAPTIRGGQYHFDLPAALTKSVDAIIMRAQASQATHTQKGDIYHTSQHSFERSSNGGNPVIVLTTAEHNTTGKNLEAVFQEGTTVNNMNIRLSRSPTHENGWVIESVDGKVSEQGMMHVVEHFIARDYNIVDSKITLPSKLQEIVDKATQKRDATNEGKPEEIKGWSHDDANLLIIDKVIKDTTEAADMLGGGKVAADFVRDTLEGIKGEVLSRTEIEYSQQRLQELVDVKEMEILRQQSEYERTQNGGWHTTEFLIKSGEVKLTGEHEFSPIKDVKMPTREEILKNGEGWAIVTHSSSRADLNRFNNKTDALIRVGSDAQAVVRPNKGFIYRVLARIDNPLMIAEAQGKSESIAIEQITTALRRNMQKNSDILERFNYRINKSPNKEQVLKTFAKELGFDAIYFEKGGIVESSILLNPKNTKILGVSKREFDANGEIKLNFTDKLGDHKALDLASTASFNMGLMRESSRYHKMFDLPEIVNLLFEVMGGKHAEVTTKLGEGTRGMAIVREGTELNAAVKLNAELFRDPEQAKATIAHELGHIVDYISKVGEHTMARGDIIGRIASLKGHLGKYYQGTPNGQKPLTKGEIKDLKKEATRLVKELSEEISAIPAVKELGITPQQIKDIFTGVMKRAEVDPNVYSVIQSASRKLKREITKAAMRGQIHPDIMKVLDRGKETNALPKDLKQQIATKFKEMFEAEVSKRKLLNRDLIHEEMYQGSKEWRPYDEAQATTTYVKYRRSSPEIFADFISALIVHPTWVKMKMPTAYEGFMNFLHEGHPKFRDNWYAIQDVINTPNGANKALAQRLMRWMRDGDMKRVEALEAQAGKHDGVNSAKFNFYDKYFAIIRDTNTLSDLKNFNLKDKDNPEFAIEDYIYSKNTAEGYISHLEFNVRELARKQQIPEDMVNLYLLTNRIALGDRSKIANPEGTTPARARQLMAEIEVKYPNIREIVDNLWLVREQWFINEVKKSDMFGAELKEKIIGNKNYVTFNVVEHMNKSFGNGMGSKLIGQIGTVKGVESPLTATVFSDLQLISAMARNRAIDKTMQMYEKAKESGLEDMFDFMKAEYETVMQNGFAVERPVEPRGEKYDGKDLELMTVMRKGKLHGFYVNKWVAKGFKRNELDSYQSWYRFSQMNAWFRNTYTVMNPAFMLFNWVRDTQRTIRNLPKVSNWDNIAILKTLRYAPHWAKGMKDGWHRFSNVPSKVMDNMRMDKSLISIAEPYGETTDMMGLERQIVQFHQSKEAWAKKVEHPVNMFLDFIRVGGQLIETQNKAGAHRYLDKYFPDMSPQQRAHFIRTQAGSPAFLRKGDSFLAYNNIFMFSNAMKEGWRGDYESFRKEPTTGKKSKWRSSEYAFNIIQSNLVPKMLMFAAAQGWMGNTEEQKAKNATIMNMTSNYVKTNYIVIPLDLVTVPSPDGKGVVQKAIIFTIPQDETARFAGGIFWQSLINSPLAHKSTRTGHFGEGLADYSAGQFPSVAPIIDLFSQTLTYLSGGNPYDPFRQQNILTDREMKAGGEFKEAAWADHVWKLAGGTLISKQWDDVPEIFGYEPTRVTLDELNEFSEGTVDDKLLHWVRDQIGIPVIGNMVGRFFKIVDSGDLAHDLTAGKYEEVMSKQDLFLNRAAKKLVSGNGDQLTQEEVDALTTPKGTTVVNKLKSIMRRFGASVWMHEFISANGNAEKQAYVIKGAFDLYEATGDRNAKQFIDTFRKEGKQGMMDNFGRSGAYPNMPLNLKK